MTYPGTTDGPSSFPGVLLKENRLTVLLPLSLVVVSGLTNLLYLTPAVIKTMKRRWDQGGCLYVCYGRRNVIISFIEKIDDKKSYDPPPHSKKMVELNKKFGKLHGFSTLINLGALVSTIVYGAVLGCRLS